MLRTRAEAEGIALGARRNRGREAGLRQPLVVEPHGHDQSSFIRPRKRNRTSFVGDDEQPAQNLGMN